MYTHTHIYIMECYYSKTDTDMENKLGIIRGDMDEEGARWGRGLRSTKYNV